MQSFHTNTINKEYKMLGPRFKLISRRFTVTPHGRRHFLCKLNRWLQLASLFLPSLHSVLERMPRTAARGWRQAWEGLRRPDQKFDPAICWWWLRRPTAEETGHAAVWRADHRPRWWRAIFLVWQCPHHVVKRSTTEP